MRFLIRCMFILCLTGTFSAHAQLKKLDWKAVEEETMQHFQTLLRMNTSDPPGNEVPAVKYLKAVLQKEGIEVKTFALERNRPNLVARIRGDGKKQPLLIMGHTDVVTVDTSRWTYPPFSATRKDGYVYGRGTLDDKCHVVSGLMTMLMLKRMQVNLSRDVIFLAEAGEEAGGKYGIEYMVREHWKEIEAEYCFAEGGTVARTAGKILYGAVTTTEKIPNRMRLVARGTAGHGSVPLRNNAIVHLANAVAKVAAWKTPMRLNETTKAFFARLADISKPEDAARYKMLLSGKNTDTVEEYLAVNVPRYYSMLRSSISPTIINGGYRSNVIPSEAEATLDIRAVPNEDIAALMQAMQKLINDSAVEVVRINTTTARPAGKPSSLNTEAFTIIEAAIKRHYNAITLPTMLTGATDMSNLRARGVQCYGIGPLVDTEDSLKGFGAHSDQERILEESLYTFIRFHWDVIIRLATSLKP